MKQQLAMLCERLQVNMDSAEGTLLQTLLQAQEQAQRLTIQEAEALYPGAFPVWVCHDGQQVFLAPVVNAYLHQSVPYLPEGMKLLIPQKEEDFFSEDATRELAQDLERLQQGQIAGEIPGTVGILIEGEAGSGKSFLLRQSCMLLDINLIEIDARGREYTPSEWNSCMLASLLYDAIVCLRIRSKEDAKAAQTLGNLGSLFVIEAEPKYASEIWTDYPLYRKRMPQLTYEDKLKIAGLAGVTGENNPQLETLLSQKLTIGHFKQALQEYQIGNYLQKKQPNLAATYERSHSSSLVSLPTNRRMEELQLPKTQYDQLVRICNMCKAREQVLSEGGFARKYAYGNGLSVLFYGAPGTGKTMTAQVLAGELKKPLYRVDLSQLISKYIGETQKNIGQIFDEAAKLDCVLLFDEADAIFAKRGEVADAQDRYSNAETAYLLQKIESYSGITLLATNLLQNFDEAFRRRISYMVYFPMPDEKLRTALWTQIFPAQTKVSKQVDFLLLAQTFEMSGASIRSAAMHAALLAASQEQEVGMPHLLDGIRNEYGKQGKVFDRNQEDILRAWS